MNEQESGSVGESNGRERREGAPDQPVLDTGYRVWEALGLSEVMVGSEIADSIKEHREPSVEKLEASFRTLGEYALRNPQYVELAERVRALRKIYRDTSEMASAIPNIMEPFASILCDELMSRRESPLELENLKVPESDQWAVTLSVYAFYGIRDCLRRATRRGKLVLSDAALLDRIRKDKGRELTKDPESRFSGEVVAKLLETLPAHEEYMSILCDRAPLKVNGEDAEWVQFKDDAEYVASRVACDLLVGFGMKMPTPWTFKRKFIDKKENKGLAKYRGARRRARSTS